MTIDPILSVRIVLVATALIAAILAFSTFQRRADAPQALAFSGLLFATAIYAFGYSGELEQTTVPRAFFWLGFENLALPWIPALWLLAALRHNRLKVSFPALFAIPTVSFVALYTNRWHGLMYGPIVMVAHGPFRLMSMPRGPIALLQYAYLFAAFTIGLRLYARSYRESDGIFRRQATLLQLSCFVPLLCFFAYLAGFSPWGLDLSPIAMALSGVLCYFSLIVLDRLDTAPLTRRLIFTSMRDAVLVLDRQQRLIDFNPAAAGLLPNLSRNRIGHSASQIFADYEGLAECLNSPHPREIALALAPHTEQQIEVRSFPLTARGRVLGYAAILADITAQAQLREQLRRHAETDPLTGVPNRRLFDDALQQECKRCNRYKIPFSLLMLDVDRFKAINDRFGHPAGDAVLRTIAERIQQSLRESDMIARYGGEEFAILLVETGLEEAHTLAERVRLAIETEPFLIGAIALSVTVSLGLATSGEGEAANPAVLLDEADSALYEAKAGGRNRVVAAQALTLPHAQPS